MSVFHLCLVHVIIGKHLTIFFLVPSLVSLLILLHFLYYIYNPCHLNTYTVAHRSLWTCLCENVLLWPSTLISFFWTFFQWISWDNVAGELATHILLLFCRSLSAQSGCVFVKWCSLIVCFVEQGCSIILYILCFQRVIVLCSKHSFMLFMPVGVIVYFCCRYSSSCWIQMDLLHWKLYSSTHYGFISPN